MLIRFMAKYNNSLSKSIIWLFLEKILLMLVLFATNVVLMRFLGPQVYGELAFFQLIISISLVLGDFGFRRVYLSQANPTLALGILPFIFKYKSYISTFVSLLLFFFVFLSGADDRYLLICILLILSPFEVYSYYYESKLKHDKLVKVRFSILLFLSVFRVLFCVYDFELIWIILTYIVHMPISNFISFVLYKNEVAKGHIKEKKLRNTSKLIILKSIKYRAAFFWFSFVVVQLHLRSDQFGVKLFLDYQALGYYAAAYKFVEQLVSLGSVLSNVILPHISSKKKSSHEDYLRKMYKVGFFVSIPLALILFLFSEYIVFLFLGEQYSSAVEPLRILAVALPFLFISNLGGVFYSINKLERYALLRNIISLFLSAIICFWLIPKIGIAGAAISTLVSYFFMAFIIEFFFPVCRLNLKLKISALKDIMNGIKCFFIKNRNVVK